MPASSSKEALNLLEKGGFDIAILEVGTSLMDRAALAEGDLSEVEEASYHRAHLHW